MHRASLMRRAHAIIHCSLLPDAPRAPDAPRTQPDASRALEMLQFSYKLTRSLWNDALHSWNVKWVTNDVKYLHIDSLLIFA